MCWKLGDYNNVVFVTNDKQAVFKHGLDFMWPRESYALPDRMPALGIAHEIERAADAVLSQTCLCRSVR